MEYPFWINDFDRVGNKYTNDYPLSKEIFKYPSSFWFGDNPKKPKKHMEGSIQRLIKRAEPQLPVFVIYNIPNRDVGQYSRGGARDREDYLEFIERFSRGIGDSNPIIIYEPDALPHSTLLDEEEQKWRLSLMKDALKYLTENTNGTIYIDVGHSNWLKPKQVAELLERVSNPKVKGFSINSCNYQKTDECIKWGKRICRMFSNSTFVIDTSRNGNGPSGDEWCNPKGRALGTPPTTKTKHRMCDAYLWIKIPGESDGRCNGGPKAGKWWGEQAEELVKNFLKNEK